MLCDQLQRLAQSWRVYAAGHYCQTYNTGMAMGLEKAATELQMLVESAFTDQPTLTEFLADLKRQKDAAYQRWRFCLEHKFEFEAKHQRALYDLLEQIVSDAERLRPEAKESQTEDSMDTRSANFIGYPAIQKWAKARRGGFRKWVTSHPRQVW